MKNKINILMIMIIICLVFTSCQPTPQKQVVQNKADDELQEGYQRTIHYFYCI